MEPLFEKICDKTSKYARVQLNNPNRKKMKDGLTFGSQMAARLSALRAGRSLPPGRFLVLISVRE
jgi:hypothetical protein